MNRMTITALCYKNFKENKNNIIISSILTSIQTIVIFIFLISHSGKSFGAVGEKLIFNALYSILIVGLGMIVVNIIYMFVVHREIINKSICYLLNMPIKIEEILLGNVIFIFSCFLCNLVFILFFIHIISFTIIKINYLPNIYNFMTLLLSITIVFIFNFLRNIVGFVKVLRIPLNFILSSLPFFIFFFGFKYINRLTKSIFIIGIAIIILMSFLLLYLSKKLNKGVTYVQAYKG